MPKKQMEIPGTEDPSIPDVDKAAQKYVDVRDKRMKLTEQEVLAKHALIEAISRHISEMSVDSEGNRVYKYDDQVVTYEERSPRVKVRTAVAGDDEDDED